MLRSRIIGLLPKVNYYIIIWLTHKVIIHTNNNSRLGNSRVSLCTGECHPSKTRFGSDLPEYVLVGKHKSIKIKPPEVCECLKAFESYVCFGGL